MAANPIGDPLVLSDICKRFLFPILQIQSVYVHQEHSAASVLVVVPRKDFSVERAIYSKQLDIIRAWSGGKFDLRVISLRGRQLSDLLVPKGKLVFERDAIAHQRQAS